MKHTRAGVIKRVEAEYRALDRVVKRLGPAGLRKPAMREEAPIRFTAKDVLAHINAWKWRQARVTSKDKGPERPYEPPRLAKIAHRFALVRSLSHGSNGHVNSTHTLLTGYPGEVVETTGVAVLCVRSRERPYL